MPILLNTVCRGLVAQVSFFATTKSSTVYSEYILYEPILEILQSQGFNVQCEFLIANGAKGDGKGSITHPVYGAVPSYADKTPNRRGGRAMNKLKAGHIYHTIFYGLNAMGPHASQISDQERWKIIMYVQSLQGNDGEIAAEVAEISEETDAITTN